MEDCVFCKIVEGKIPSAKVYETDTVMAFLDISPVKRGHVLIVPKNHSKNIMEDDLEDLKGCMEAAKTVGRALMDATGASGFNLITNTGRAAGQAVFHTHFHIIPRHEDDGLEPWHGKSYDEGEMRKVQESIIDELGKV